MRPPSISNIATFSFIVALSFFPAIAPTAATYKDSVLTLRNELFVMSAGNDSRNNDNLLPPRAYLSRFFPNI